jgi:Ras-related protein Rab-2A
VYNSTDSRALQKLRSYLEHFRNNADEITKVYLIANYVDSIHKTVSYAQGLQFAKDLGIQFFEVSAKTGQGIAEMFIYILNDLQSPKTQKN